MEPKVHRVFGTRDDLMEPRVVGGTYTITVNGKTTRPIPWDASEETRDAYVYEIMWARVEEYVDAKRANELWFLYQQGRIRNLTLHVDADMEYVTYDTPA